MAQLAELADVTQEEATDFWLQLGLPANKDASAERQFTTMDGEAIAAMRTVAQEAHLSEDTTRSLVRALGYTCDRLSLWQMEALVEDVATELHLDDISARLVVLDRLDELVPLLEKQLLHAWRRQLAAIAGRYFVEFGTAGRSRFSDDALPLVRGIGFADMVDYTTRTAGLGSRELAELVHRFETLVRQVVISLGGRVVKTLGDAVMFVTDDAETGAKIALGLARAMGPQAGLPDVRVSMCYGRMLSRFGDVFGPPVNVAARLNEVAGPRQVLTDKHTAQALKHLTGVRFTALPPRDFVGVGRIMPVELADELPSQ